MIYANVNNNKEKAKPKTIGYCPDCNSLMTPKCGTKMIWHWAHKNKDVICNYKGETEWYRYWKSKFNKDECEIIMDYYGIKHIADVFKNNTVIEFQHSPITEDEIENRNYFYNFMDYKVIWVFDLKKQYENEQITLWNNDMVWRHKKHYITNSLFSNNTILLNLEGDNLYEIIDEYEEETYYFINPYTGKEQEGIRPTKYKVKKIMNIYDKLL